MARRLSSEGATTILLARSKQQLETLAASLPGDSLVVTADVREGSSVSNAVDIMLDEYSVVDTVINNAGVSLTSLTGERKCVVDIEEDEWDTVVETNLKGVFLVTKHLLPAMLDREHGNIINISSGLGRRSAPKWEPYSTTKWGVEGFTRSLALEVKKAGINVNGIDPGGGVNTDFAQHVSETERENRLPPDTMNDSIVRLAEQSPNGITGQSMTAGEWEDVFASMITSDE
jgi:3-oxoacyl-[acyl-carrier protein] reductase